MLPLESSLEIQAKLSGRQVGLQSQVPQLSAIQELEAHLWERALGGIRAHETGCGCLETRIKNIDNTKHQHECVEIHMFACIHLNQDNNPYGIKCKDLSL